MATEDATEKQEGDFRIDDAAQSDVISRRTAQPEQEASAHPRPSQEAQAEVPVEVHQHRVQGEERDRVAPQVLEVSVQEGHGQNAGQAFRSQRAVSEAAPVQVELRIDEVHAPNEGEQSKGDGEGKADALPVGFQEGFLLIRWNGMGPTHPRTEGTRTGSNAHIARGMRRGSPAELRRRGRIHMAVVIRTHPIKIARKTQNYFAGQEPESAMSVTELHALISLLEDPDEGIYNTVKQELERIGEAAVPSLRKALEEDGHGSVFLDRAKSLLDQLATDEIRSSFADWVDSNDLGLTTALLLLDQYVDPASETSTLREDLLRIRQDIWLELHDDMTALEQVRVVNRIFFEHHGFEGTKGGAARPTHALPSEVLRQRKGNSLALGAVYLAMVQELDLPIHGVNLPNHFILAYCDGGHLGEFSSDGGPGSVLFYINPFNQGGIIHPEEVSAFLGHLDLPVDQGHCGPCHPVDVMRRLIGNLAYAYERQEDLSQAERLRELLFFVEGCSAPQSAERSE